MKTRLILYMTVLFAVYAPATNAQPIKKLFNPPQPVNQFKSALSSEQKLDSSVSAIWDIQAEQFVFTEKYEYTYNELGQIAMLSFLKWDQAENRWTDFARENYTYNASGKLLTSLSLQWDAIAGVWVNFTQTASHWDANGRNAGWEYYEWDDIREWLQGLYKDERAYDENGFESSFANYSGDTVTNQWIGNLKYEFTNNNQGRRVVQRSLTGMESLPVSDLPGGIYMYGVTVGSKIYHGKIVKE
jgi:hypothetical protein